MMTTRAKLTAAIVVALTSIAAAFGYRFVVAPQIEPIPTPAPIVSASPVPTAAPTSSPAPTAVPTSQSTPGSVAVYAGCKMGAPNDIWNHDVTNDAVDPNSAAHIKATYALDSQGFYAAEPLYVINTGTDPLIPVTSGTMANVPVSIPYRASAQFEPVPRLVQGQGDGHYLYLQTATCTAYEAYNAAYRAASNTFYMYSGNSYQTNTPNAGAHPIRGQHASPITAGGLDLMVGMVKYEEIKALNIPHAVILSQDIYSVGGPARYPGTDVPAPFKGVGTPLGYDSHLRLKATYNDPRASKECSAVLAALKHYGGYVNDTSSPGVSGAVYFANAESDPPGALYKPMDFSCLGRVHITDMDELLPVVRP